MEAQISIPLDIPDVRVLKTQMSPAGDYIITVESTWIVGSAASAVERLRSGMVTMIGFVCAI